MMLKNLPKKGPWTEGPQAEGICPFGGRNAPLVKHLKKEASRYIEMGPNTASRWIPFQRTEKHVFEGFVRYASKTWLLGRCHWGAEKCFSVEPTEKLVLEVFQPTEKNVFEGFARYAAEIWLLGGATENHVFASFRGLPRSSKRGNI